MLTEGCHNLRNLFPHLWLHSACCCHSDKPAGILEPRQDGCKDLHVADVRGEAFHRCPPHVGVGLYESLRKHCPGRSGHVGIRVGHAAGKCKHRLKVHLVHELAYGVNCRHANLRLGIFEVQEEDVAHRHSQPPVRGTDCFSDGMKPVSASRLQQTTERIDQPLSRRGIQTGLPRELCQDCSTSADVHPWEQGPGCFPDIRVWISQCPAQDFLVPGIHLELKRAEARQRGGPNTGVCVL
mmetsp:Transcript_35448/g.81786  ORF Transcript_35448/g.81786 Transcript_35448/m.81786 type:complete len:239 (+) Transcript_35448:282-998(+)